jgi:outer membrane protein assembly factor BamB
MPSFSASRLLAFGLLAGSAAWGEADWPQWRGPKRDAVSTEKGLLQKWEEGGPPLAWKSAGLGRGYSSVAITQGRIFTIGRRKEGDFILALDGKDGREVWSARLGDGGGEIPGGTPTVDGERLYAVGPQGDLVCAATDTGKEVWRKSFTADFGGAVPGWRYCESPLIDGDRLICTPGGKDATMVALDKKTGDVQWKCAIPKGPGGGYGYSSIMVSEAAGVRQYVQMLGAGTGCVGVAARDGTFLWKYPRTANGTATIPTPVIDGDYVFCSSAYGTGSALLKLSKDGEGVKAEEVYFLGGKQFQNHHGGLIHLGEHIFAGHGHNDGRPICLEMKTGKIVWGGDQKGPGTGSAAIVFADGQLYFRYENGVIALIGASSDGYALNGSFKLPKTGGPSWSHPVVLGGLLYLREQDALYVYNVAAK